MLKALPRPIPSEPSHPVAFESSRGLPPARVGRLNPVLRSRTAQVAVSLLLAGGLLFVFLRRARLSDISAAISSASPAWILAALVLSLLTFALRAARWCWILRPVARVPFLPSFLATAVGFAANNLPAKAGEVIRPALLARARALPFSPLLASIFLERVLDGASVLAFFLLAAALGHPPSGGVGVVLVPAAVLVAVSTFVLFAVFRREATERVLEAVAGRLPKAFRSRARGFALTFVDGFASIREPGLFSTIAVGSLLLWLLINLQIAMVLFAFHLSLPLPASFVVTTAAVLGLAVPTPGGLGSYQAMVQYTLMRFYGVAAAPASGVAILAWAISFIPITLIGVAGLATKSLRAPAGRAAVDVRRQTGQDTSSEA